MARKTGVGVLLRLARRMCKLLNLYYDTIRILADDDPVVLAALAAAQLACVGLQNAIGPLRTYGD